MSSTPGLRRVLAGGVAWVVMVFYFVAEFVVASAWPVPYRATTYSISSLGDTVCRSAAQSGSGSICSPLHLVMNIAFVITGLLVIAGAVGLRELLPPSRLRRAALGLLLVTGLSTSLTGLVPVNVNPTVHWIVAAPTFIARNAAMAVLAWPLLERWRSFGMWTVLCFSVGTVGTVLILVAATPFGITERAAIYPFTAWAVTAGVVVIVRITGRADS